MADLRPGSDDVYVATRRQLHGVAEILIAGPQYRTSGTIRLAVTPAGFRGVTLPVAVEGTELVWPHGHAPLAGPVVDLAAAAGVDAGPPVDVYHSSSPLTVDDVVRLDGDSCTLVQRSLWAGANALKIFGADQEPVLWPEHFDVAITIDEVSYSVSAGDSYHPRPYAYVGPWTARTGPFWNAPFGALLTLAADPDIYSIVDFFSEGKELTR